MADRCSRCATATTAVVALTEQVRALREHEAVLLGERDEAIARTDRALVVAERLAADAQKLVGAYRWRAATDKRQAPSCAATPGVPATEVHGMRPELAAMRDAVLLDDLRHILPTLREHGHAGCAANCPGKQRNDLIDGLLAKLGA